MEPGFSCYPVTPQKQRRELESIDRILNQLKDPVRITFPDTHFPSSSSLRNPSSGAAQKTESQGTQISDAALKHCTSSDLLEKETILRDRKNTYQRIKYAEEVKMAKEGHRSAILRQIGKRIQRANSAASRRLATKNKILSNVQQPQPSISEKKD